jgi:hypothetical protein
MLAAAAALAPFGLAACDGGQVTEGEVEQAADDVENAGSELLQESEQALDQAGGSLQNIAEDAGNAAEGAARETGEALENVGDDR